MQHWSKLVPELTVHDFAASLEFYTNLIGFHVMHRRSDPDFAYLDQEMAQIMIEQRHEHREITVGQSWETGVLEKPLGRGINFQIELESIQSVYDRLKERQYPLFKDIYEDWYPVNTVLMGQRQFLVQDPDGYLLRFCQAIGERPL